MKMYALCMLLGYAAGALAAEQPQLYYIDTSQMNPIGEGDLQAHRFAGTKWEPAGRLVSYTPSKNWIDSARGCITDLCRASYGCLKDEFVRSAMCGVGSAASTAYAIYSLCSLNPTTFSSTSLCLSGLCASYVMGATLPGEKAFFLPLLTSGAGAFVGWVIAARIRYGSPL